MILGIISDIHCNSWALQEVINKNSQVDTWICVGDFVGLLPQINETINLLLKHNIISIHGDHEISLLSNKKLTNSFSGNQVIQIQKKAIANNNRIWVESLPKEKIISIDNLRFLIKHVITGNSTIRKYNFNFDKLEKKYSEFDFVLFGHTHIPCYWEGKQTIFLNPGSLGFPVSKNKRGSYAVIDTKTLHSNFFSVQIDKQPCILTLKQQGYPQKIIELVEERFI